MCAELEEQPEQFWVDTNTKRKPPKRKSALVFLIAALALPPQEAMLNSARCDTACKIIGYDLGYFHTERKTCWCVTEKEFKELTKTKRLVIPPPRAPMQDVVYE